MIAAGRVSGKTSAVIASESGLSESTVRKQAVHPRTQTLIQELKLLHRPQLERTFQKALDKTEELIGNEDPIVALRASKLAVDMVTASDPPLAQAGIEHR